MTAEANSHDTWRDSAALYALDALAGDERRAFEAHLQSCADCATELLTLRPVAGALAQVVPQVDPPAALKARVMAAAVSAQGSQAEPGNRAVTTAVMPTVPATGGAVSTLRRLSMAAMLVLAVGLAAYSNSLRARVARLEEQLALALAQSAELQAQVNDTRRTLATAQTHLAVFSAPDSTRINLAGQSPALAASGRADWSRSSGLALSVANLPALQTKRTYQVWLLTAGNPVSVGLLQPDATGRLSAVYTTPPDVPEPTGVALSEEPEGGVPLPTGQIYLVGLISRAQ
jgi:anti-sigma-K factor RskA